MLIRPGSLPGLVEYAVYEDGEEVGECGAADEQEQAEEDDAGGRIVKPDVHYDGEDHGEEDGDRQVPEAEEQRIPNSAQVALLVLCRDGEGEEEYTGKEEDKEPHRVLEEAPGLVDHVIDNVKVRAEEERHSEDREPQECCAFEILAEGAEIRPNEILVLAAHHAEGEIAHGGQGRADREDGDGCHEEQRVQDDEVPDAGKEAGHRIIGRKKTIEHEITFHWNE